MDFRALLQEHNASPEISEAFEAFLASTESERQAKDLELAAIQEKLLSLETKSKRDDVVIEALKFELARLNRIRFAKKSEAFKGVQGDLFQEALDEDLGELARAIENAEATGEEGGETQPKTRKPRASAGRNPFPKEFPRVVIRHDLEHCTCGECGSDMHPMGEDVTEKLKIIPIQFIVEEHVRPKYACRTCETIKAAPVPPSLIEGGMATPSVLTWVVISKYTDHLPLYRLSQIAERSGLTLSQSTLGNWVGQVGFDLHPLYDRLKEKLLLSRVLHADETPIKQLDPGSGKGKTHQAYLWAYRNNDLDEGPPIVLFDYQTGRSGHYARDYLGDWRGFLCVDSYSGYKALFNPKDPEEIPCIEVGCLAHARRKFFELHAANQSPMAAEALRQIARLYAVEEEAREMSIEQRKALREEKSLPVLEGLKGFLTEGLTKSAPGGAAAKAIKYSLKRWDALERFAFSGHLPIDNNAIERDIRPIAVGKKGWLFAGSERAGKRAAVIQSLLGTAKLNGVNPYEWLENTLEYLPIWPNRRVDELLPLKGWKPVTLD